MMDEVVDDGLGFMRIVFTGVSASTGSTAVAVTLDQHVVVLALLLLLLLFAS